MEIEDEEISSEGVGSTFDIDSVTTPTSNIPIADAQKKFQTEVESEISNYLDPRKPPSKTFVVPKGQEKQPGTEAEEKPKAKVIGNYTVLRPIRTYKDDVENMVQNQNLSMAKIAIAQNDKQISQDEESQEESTNKNTPAIIASIVLVVLGVLILVGFYVFYSPNQNNSTPEFTVPSYIPIDTKKEISMKDLVDNSDMKTVLGNFIKNEQITVDSIEQFFITQMVGGTKQIINTTKFFDAVEAKIPPSLLRSLENQFTLGIHSFNGNNPFIILKTNFYQNAFAGMLSWEETMPDDLSGWFYSPTKFSVASSASSDQMLFGSKYQFIDSVIKNKDARVLKDTKGNTVLLYSLVDKETIVITTSEYTLKEVFNRLIAGKLVR